MWMSTTDLEFVEFYIFETLSIYLSILQHPLARIMCRVDCDLKSDARTEKVKGDSIKRTSAEFKKQVKNSFIVVLCCTLHQCIANLLNDITKTRLFKYKENFTSKN